MAAALRSPHYVAVVEVTRVTPPSRVFKSAYDKEGTELAREVEDVARVVVRAASLDDLQASVTGHLALLHDPTFPVEPAPEF